MLLSRMEGEDEKNEEKQKKKKKSGMLLKKSESTWMEAIIPSHFVTHLSLSLQNDPKP